MIKGIYGDEADKLNPEQWIDVYHLDFTGRAIYHSSCQVKKLNLDDPEDHGLEPTDENGNLMSVKEACCRAKLEDGTISPLYSNTAYSEYALRRTKIPLEDVKLLFRG